MEYIHPLPPPPDLLQSYKSFRKIKCVVVPVGDVPEDKFNFYLDLISSFSESELLDINPEHKQGPFPNRDWKSAMIRLSLDTETEQIQHDMDGGWDILRSDRRVLCVVGILLCHQYPDLQDGLTLFDTIVSNYPHAVACKCFAFEPMQDQPDLYAGNLIMVPDGDLVRLGFYIQRQIMDLAATILSEFDKWMTKGSIQEQAAYISTSLDSIDDVDSINKLKKRKQGRLNKCKGDWCLLAGSPQDAIIHYNAAIDQTRANNDWVWLGAALEGLVAANLSWNNFELPNIETTGSTTDEMVLRINEAIASYKKRNANNLALESTFRLIWYHIDAGRRKEAADLLMDAYETALEFPLYNKIIITSAIALCFQSIQYMRKFAFFIRECAVLYHKFHKPHAAHNLLSMVAKHYQLEELDEIQSAVSVRTRSPFGEIPPINIANARRPLKDKTRRDWTYLQKIMMQNLVRTSKGLNDPISIARYAAYLLKALPHALNESTQLHYLNELLGAVQSVPGFPYKPLQLDMVGLPLLKKLCPVPLPSHLSPIALEVIESRKLFIYSPYQKKQNSNIIYWIQNEISQTKVELSNLTAFPIEVEEMRLSTAGAAFEAYPISFTIPPRTASYEVVLSGKPLDRSGNLTIIGCIIKCFGIVCEHPVNSQGVGISLKEYDYMIKHPPRQAPTNAVNKVTLIPSLPLLSIHSAATSNDATLLKLRHGEKYTLAIHIDNIGTQTIHSLQLQIEEQHKQLVSATLSAAPPPPAYSAYELEEEPLSFTFDAQRIQDSLPLHPGQSLQLPIDIYIKPWAPCIGGEFTFNYGSQSCMEFGRRFTLNIPFSVKKGLEVIHFDVLPTTTPLADSVGNQGEHPQKLPADFCLLVMDVLNPTSHNFNLEWTVQNNNPGQPPRCHSHMVTQEEKSVQRVVIPIQRFLLDEDHIPPVREQKGQYIKPTEKISPEQERESRILYWYKNELLKRVHMTWKSVILGTKGELYMFPKMFLTPPLLSIMRANKVSFCFSVYGEKTPSISSLSSSSSSSDHLDGEAASNAQNNSNNNAVAVSAAVNDHVHLFHAYMEKKEQHYFYPTFQFRKIKFVVANTCGKDISQAFISVQPFQDQENGGKELPVGSKFAWNGSLEYRLEKLSAGENYEIELPVCFFAAGTYKFVVSCEDTTSNQIAFSKPLRICAF